MGETEVNLVVACSQLKWNFALGAGGSFPERAAVARRVCLLRCQGRWRAGRSRFYEREGNFLFGSNATGMAW